MGDGATRPAVCAFNTLPTHTHKHTNYTHTQAFLDGFWEMVPRDLLSVFNDHELELLISGLPDIDVADLRANTEYQVGGYTQKHTQTHV